jgi:hypothetical protein
MQKGFIFQAGRFRTLPFPTGTWVNGLNNNNDTVGAFVGETETGYKAHGWWLQGYGGDTVVEDVNDAGLMAVTCHNSPHEGAVTSYAYDGERWVELTVPDSYGTVVSG